jgi:hypothetical protein
MAVYALLVGINEYTVLTKLEGCVNDVENLDTLLRARVTGSPLHVEKLLDAQATYAGVTDSFRRHLGQAGPGDVAVFAYAGHGSTQKAAPELLEPDGRSETLVCVDSRTGTVRDLADVELKALIASVVAKGAEVACIFDCCHSGTVSRDDGPGEPEPGERRAPSDDRERSLDTYLPELRDLLGGSGASRGAGGDGASVAMASVSRHVALSACQSDEKAKEVADGGRTRGAFSVALAQALAIEGPTASVRQIARTAAARVRQLTAKQRPVAYATVDADLDRPFLGAGAAGADRSFRLSRSVDGSWEVDGGSLHGLTAPVGGRAARLAVSETGQDERLGDVEVVTVEPTRSVVTPLDGLALDSAKQYRASVSSLPLAPLVVELAGEMGAAAAEAVTRSPLLGLEPRDGAARVVVRVDGDHVVIEGADGTIICEDAGTPDAAGAATLVGLLEHLARWYQVLALENPSSSLASQVALEWVEVRPGDSTLDLARPASPPPARDGGVTLDCTRGADGALQPATWFLRVVNRSEPPQDLHVRLLVLSDDFSLDPTTLWDLNDPLKAGSQEGAFGRRPVSIYPSGSALPGTVVTNYVKLLVSADDLDDASLLGLPPLGKAVGGERGMGAPVDAPAGTDWGAQTIPVFIRIPDDLPTS